ncbi:ScyD/ScyE family protein [Microlunatus panaciterrae]|uniref:ScyD/ScyE family protein n=1 Tax=Microlunatus panaciterrae TaxID=400768 RepID=A0ABS2RLM5_9ACTN|nr:ScyD/ScyE family protein [Microlunatus panaciterrae]MBM7799916.1 hypothetical protein [Microlunatus panaciterrae]
MRKKMLGAAAVATTALFATMSVPASAHGQYDPYQPQVHVVNTQVIAPFSLALSKRHVYVADGGTSLVSRLSGGTLKTVAEGPQPGEVAGLDVTRSGRSLAYTSTNYATGDTALNIYGPRGSRTTADLSTYERTKNPDSGMNYGVDNPSPCVKAALESIPDGPPASYAGLVDSHPYAVAAVGKHSWVVADAGGNDLLKVDRRGHISTLAILPRHPLKITKEIAAGLHMPDCVIGVTYNFEAVPTDVEVGPGGWLYVSTLAGGPEDPSLGARSKVFKVNPWNGHVTQIGSGFLGATDLALGRDGRIYVAELFGGRISVLDHGKRRTYVDLPNALSVESGHDGLWAGTMAEMGPEGPVGNGSIVHITRR